MNKNEEEILSRLLLDEEVTLRKLDEIVALAEKLFKLDPKTKSVVLSDSIRTHGSVKDKITVLLVAQYFGAKKIKIGDSYFFGTEKISGREIADFFGKKITSISGRLTDLIKDGVVGRDDQSKYFIHHHKVESVLAVLNSKFEKE